jgi:hypothetical protein
LSRKLRNGAFTLLDKTHSELPKSHMAKFALRVDPTFRASSSGPNARLRVVSREPFSAVASFLLGLTAGLGVALGLFVIFFR